MTLLSELIEIPEQVHKSDFVISLETAIEEPERTLKDYVVTDQLVACFDKALSLVATSLKDHRSKSSYLHASFGAGKTAMMAVLDLLLQGNPAARSVPELAPLVLRYGPQLDGKRFLLVPFRFVGRSSMEQEILGGYVSHIQRLHPGKPLPAVYVADGVLDDAKTKRSELGDEVFFRVLSEGEAEDEWGDFGGGWDAPRFEAALASPPGSSAHEQLVGALLRTHYRALPGMAEATAEGFVPLDKGLDAISRHAKSLGYDAVVLFLDELVLWLASRMADVAFVSREGAKVVHLVEADAAERPAPIVSFIARQRDLRELVGENVPGAQSLSAIDILRHSEGRFDTITLEDRNLPAIAERRLLRPRSEQARQTLDDAFELVRRDLEQRDERDYLLTDTGDLAEFRRLYPFSPALVQALVALSSAMQRERTALRVMLQLLVNGRNHLEVGQLIPLGDLWDAINAGDEPLTEVMRSQFAQARRLWTQRFQPMLLRTHGLDEEAASDLPTTHPYVTDVRLVKSLLVAALVPGVDVLRDLTVSRLTALNSGVVRAIVPGMERQQVLDKLRRWQAEVGELRVGDDDQDPYVSVVLTGIDTGPILDAVRMADTQGERKRQLRTIIIEALQIKDPESLRPAVEVTWRGTRRRIDVVFANVRDAEDLPDDMLRAGPDPLLVIDYPMDDEGFTPSDDRSRVQAYRQQRPPEWTAVWLPNFLTAASAKLLGRFVQLHHALKDEVWEKVSAYLAPGDRATAKAQLANERLGLRSRLETAVRQAYAVDPIQNDLIEDLLSPADQFLSLDPALGLRPPVGTGLRSCMEGIADQLFRYRYPKHPEFTDLVTRAELTLTREQVALALHQPNGRLENVAPNVRRTLTKVAAPLALGTMYAAHFVANLGEWKDLVERRRAEAGTATMTVAQVRRWLDGADRPAERRGLTTEVADVVLLLVAAATNRALLAGGLPVPRPEIGKIRDDWELRTQDLPTPEVWQEALKRAEDMGVVPVSRLLSASSVADLAQRIREGVVANRADSARDLVPQLQDALQRFGLPGDAKRLRTAKAATDFVAALHRRPDHAPSVLAELTIPTTAAALGTSIARASSVEGELRRTNWELIETAGSLGGQWAGDAGRLREKLAEALADDELSVGLVMALGSATRAATELMGRAAAVSPPPPTAPVATSALTPAPAATEPSLTFDRTVADEQLRMLKRQLREIGLDLTWQIEEVNDAER
jgi:hypothetical protein